MKQTQHFIVQIQLNHIWQQYDNQLWFDKHTAKIALKQARERTNYPTRLIRVLWEEVK